MKRLAFIDLGSNSVRMNIIQINDNGSYYLMDQVKQMVRLSQGMGNEKTLKPEPIRRTIEALMLFRKLIDVYQVTVVHGVATAAVRQAVNQEAFLKEVRDKTEMEFEVISGHDEAYYDFLGVMNTIDAPDCLVVDIGGASTELVWVTDRKIRESISLPFGSVTLSERFLSKEYTPADLEKLRTFIVKEFKSIRWLKKAKGLPVLGLGGIIRTIGKIDKNRVRFPVLSIHNYQITDVEVEMVYQKVVSSTPEDLKAVAGIGKSRADLMAGGIMPIKCVMDLIDSKKLIISGNGLRDGLFYKRELLGPDEELVPDVLEHSLSNLLKRYDVNCPHADHVNMLCMSLFDQLRGDHKFTRFHRKILHGAALLHDIGMHIDYFNHHYHGFYLVMNADLNGLSNRERVLTAFLVGHHRESSFREDWHKYRAVMNAKDYDDIRRLALLLKIAEKLDRSEAGLVESVSVQTDKKMVTLRLKSQADLSLEVAAVVQYRAEFQRMMKKELVVAVDLT